MRFNQLLVDAGIDPTNVRLLRHAPHVAGHSLLDLWRSDTATLEDWQAIQLTSQRTSFARSIWASFVGTWDGRTVFIGLYEVTAREEVAGGTIEPLTGEVHLAGTRDRYTTALLPALHDVRGRLFVDWGGGSSGKRAWNQRADMQDKPITELQRDITIAPFPGLMTINMPLSNLAAIPTSWIEHLSAARGVYLLTCPRDGSRYVGSATAAGGFWTRWSSYAANGHGGNIGMIGRDPSDFHVTILQVASSVDTFDDILAAEAVWKDKLHTRIWGLNLN